MKQWSSDVILFTNGETEIEPDTKKRLECNGLTICIDKIERLEGDAEGRLSSIRLVGGRAVRREALFFATGRCSAPIFGKHLAASETRRVACL
jgi:hypothetical protein